MTNQEKQDVIQGFIAAYNRMDIPSMLEMLHPDIVFTNRSGGAVTATAQGLEEFKTLAEQGVAVFSQRRQTVTRFSFDREKVVADIDYYAVLAVDLSPDMRAGAELRLAGRSEYAFRDGKIVSLLDES